jgi:hypothetical protein
LPNLSNHGYLVRFIEFPTHIIRHGTQKAYSAFHNRGFKNSSYVTRGVLKSIVGRYEDSIRNNDYLEETRQGTKVVLSQF